MYKRIKELRNEKKLSQKDIAEKLNISQQQYSNIETGISEINAKQIIVLTKLYKVSSDYILELSDKK